MATWKKLATFNSDGQIEGSITGVSHGGLSEVLPINMGGTGQSNLGDGEPVSGSILTWGDDGLAWVAPPDSGGKILVSLQTNEWGWKDIATSHNHDNNYIPLASGTDQEFVGNLLVGGGLDIGGNLIFNTFSEISSANSETAALQPGADSGDGSGWYIGSGGISSDDPCLLWETNYMGAGVGGWTVGTYATDMRGIVMTSQTDIDIAVSPTHPGVIGKTSAGAVYISV